MSLAMSRPIEVLLVEDNPGDVRLTEEALKGGGLMIHVNVASNGVEATNFLWRRGSYANAPRPDLILLDLHLPGKSGGEVLQEIKADLDLRRIPVMVLTRSMAEQDLNRAYNLHANCFIAKPVDLDQYQSMARSIENFWFHIVTLPGE